jgi:hypothetical protein
VATGCTWSKRARGEEARKSAIERGGDNRRHTADRQHESRNVAVQAIE